MLASSVNIGAFTAQGRVARTPVAVELLGHTYRPWLHRAELFAQLVEAPPRIVAGGSYRRLQRLRDHRRQLRDDERLVGRRKSARQIEDLLAGWCVCGHRGLLSPDGN